MPAGVSWVSPTTPANLTLPRPRSSGDRSSASGAEGAGSNPAEGADGNCSFVRYTFVVIDGDMAQRPTYVSALLSPTTFGRLRQARSPGRSLLRST